MNKQISEKIKFMLMGLAYRINENRDFIKEISFVFKSGLKEYKGKYDLERGTVNFNGKDEEITVNDLPGYIAEQAASYEALDFMLDERGKVTLLQADNKSVKTKQMDSLKDNDEKEIKTSQILNRNYIIKIGEADNLLKEIGILTKDGKVKNDMIRKYNQIDHFVELIDKLIDDISDVETLTILDCGCGKSYLSFVLNYYIKEKKKKNCYFIGVDRSKNVIQASREAATRLGYKNMEFVEEDINFYEPNRRIDMVISLHACDTATDMALGLAVRVNARSIVCVPCCHKELLEQFSFSEFNEILKHGVFKARFADILTDGIRSLLLETQGYKVSTVEYISPLETPKNLLIRAQKVSDRNEKAIEEYIKLRDMFGIYPYLESFIEL